MGEPRTAAPGMAAPATACPRATARGKDDEHDGREARGQGMTIG